MFIKANNVNDFKRHKTLCKKLFVLIIFQLLDSELNITIRLVRFSLILYVTKFNYLTLLLIILLYFSYKTFNYNIFLINICLIR